MNSQPVLHAPLAGAFFSMRTEHPDRIVEPCGVNELAEVLQNVFQVDHLDPGLIIRINQPTYLADIDYATTVNELLIAANLRLIEKSSHALITFSSHETSWSTLLDKQATSSGD